MKVVIIPSLTELKIKLNPRPKTTIAKPPNIIMPWMFAPCPEAMPKGLIEAEIKGSTLKEFLNEISSHYKKAGVDLEIINAKRNDVDLDYEVFLNGKKYTELPFGLETKLEKGNEVVVKMVMLFDG